MMRLMRGLLLSAFGPQAVGVGESKEQAKRQKLDLGEAERRWQAVFPNEPELTTSLNAPPKRVVCPKPFVDAVSVGAFRPQPHRHDRPGVLSGLKLRVCVRVAELRDGCAIEQVDQAVAQYCARVLSKVMLEAAPLVAAAKAASPSKSDSVGWYAYHTSLAVSLSLHLTPSSPA
jgi:hypothetical protein